MANVLRNYFPAMRQKLCGEQSSLYSFPEVALARLLTLRLSKKNGFMLDVFGLTMVKDVSNQHNSTKQVRLHGKDVDVRRPRNDHWLSTYTVESLRHAMEGLAFAAKHLLPPSVLRHLEIRELASLISKLWVDKGEYVETTELYDIFQMRLDEHSMSVRAKVAGELDEIDHLRSSVMMQQIKATADIRISQSRLWHRPRKVSERL